MNRDVIARCSHVPRPALQRVARETGLASMAFDWGASSKGDGRAEECPSCIINIRAAAGASACRNNSEDSYRRLTSRRSRQAAAVVARR